MKTVGNAGRGIILGKAAARVCAAWTDARTFTRVRIGGSRVLTTIRMCPCLLPVPRPCSCSGIQRNKTACLHWPLDLSIHGCLRLTIIIKKLPMKNNKNNRYNERFKRIKKLLQNVILLKYHIAHIVIILSLYFTWTMWFGLSYKDLHTLFIIIVLKHKSGENKKVKRKDIRPKASREMHYPQRCISEKKLKEMRIIL